MNLVRSNGCISRLIVTTTLTLWECKDMIVGKSKTGFILYSPSWKRHGAAHTWEMHSFFTSLLFLFSLNALFYEKSIRLVESSMARC